jgi:ankyrin repeat protein
MKRGCSVVASLSAPKPLCASPSNIADAAMRGNRDAVRSLMRQKANVNAPQNDGTTALHWAVREDDLHTAELLIRAGANVSAANRDGATPLLLASVNGNAAMLEKLIKAGADPNAPLTEYGDTALMMASRTGRTEAVKLLLEPIDGKPGAQVNRRETWGGTTALMWAVSELHPPVVKMLIEHGADVNARSKFVPSATGRGFEGISPVDSKPDQSAEEHASGSLTPLMFAAREGDVESGRILIAAGADVNAIAGDGKDVLSMAIFNGNYELASLLIDNHAQVNHADAQGFTPLFWAVDRRNMETPPNFPWMAATDPLLLIMKLLDAGANPNALVNNTPGAPTRDGSPRIACATALMRAAFSGDLEVVKLLLASGADPHIVSKDRQTTLMAAAGTGLISGGSKGRSAAERLEVVKLLVQVGEDVNAADNFGITPLMAAVNAGDMPIIQYLIDQGAGLAAHDLSKKNDHLGVGTFLPNNAVIIHEEPVKLMSRLMQERGIRHTTSEWTSRGFTCSGASVDPKTATPAEIAKVRKIQIGYQVDGITGGVVKDSAKDQDKAQDNAQK